MGMIMAVFQQQPDQQQQEIASCVALSMTLFLKAKHFLADTAAVDINDDDGKMQLPIQSCQSADGAS